MMLNLLIILHLISQQVLIEAEEIKFVSKRITQSSSSKHYSIGIEYPQIISGAGKNIIKSNRHIRNLIITELNQFKSGIEIPPKREYMPKVLNFLSTDYKVTFKSQNVVSIVFNKDDYEWPAAHPQNYTLCINLDITKGSVIKLQDLFRPNSNYRQRIGEICEEYFNGRGEKPQNFSNWNLIHKGIVVNFYRCEILGCSDGKQRVVIRATKLTDILSQKGKKLLLLK